MKSLKKQIESIGYYENLPKSTLNIIRQALLNASKNIVPEGYKISEDCFEDLECHSRGGFIPNSYNKGGLVYKNFTTLMDYWGGGYQVSHKQANKEIKRLIDLNFEYISDSLYDYIGKERYEYVFGEQNKYKTLTYYNLQTLIDTLKKQNDHTINININTQDILNKSIKEKQHWLNKIQDLETEYLNDDNSTIMHELRFMYHGKVNGVHSANVSAAINTEAPYHRSSIPWAPNIFCEGAKEIEIEWTTNKELKNILNDTLQSLIKSVF